MRDDLIMYILMHSDAEWQKLIGKSVSETKVFVKWVWAQVKSPSKLPAEEWLQEKITEFSQ